jgi:hypothetical protein
MSVESIRRGSRHFLDSATQTFAWHLSALIWQRGVAFRGLIRFNSEETRSTERQS